MKNAEKFNAHLVPTEFIDSDHPEVIDFAKQSCMDGAPPKQKAIDLYIAVRDGIRYDPYQFDISRAGMKASSVLRRRAGFCIPKAVLLAAVARVEGIPSRLGFADVKNHLTTERLRKMMGTDIFAYHGYTELLIDGKWVKATPAFNLSLCKAKGVIPLEFDGVHDSMFQQFDIHGNRHMEYIKDRGQFADLPYEDIVKSFAEFYSGNRPGGFGRSTGDFETDVRNES
jgi:transglutaminase-like putative cysteine protease